MSWRDSLKKDPVFAMAPGLFLCELLPLLSFSPQRSRRGSVRDSPDRRHQRFDDGDQSPQV
jgi:hypothetical protein